MDDAVVTSARDLSAHSTAADRTGETERTAADLPFLTTGNPRPVLQAASEALARGEPAVLALVLEADGSTYSHAGSVALFAGETQVGWLSGGCLEPELTRRAAHAAVTGRLGWIEIDTRDDGALFSGAALGCRGRLRIALLPLASLPAIEACIARWLDGAVELNIALGLDGRVDFASGDAMQHVVLPCDALPWTADATRWSLPVARLPEVLLLGAGPETSMLVGLLRDLGWRVSADEPRLRWQASVASADASISTDAQRQHARACADAALVMHHDFERDLHALQTLAFSRVAFVGLLGPPRRRDDLLKLLHAREREALLPRLHAPVGLDLGGQGPEAIALSIAAQLQAWRAQYDTTRSA